MSFHDFWLAMSPEEREAFAGKCGSTVKYLGHISTGFRKPSAHRLVPAIAAASMYRVTPFMLRPDIFAAPDDGVPPAFRARQAA